MIGARERATLIALPTLLRATGIVPEIDVLTKEKSDG